MDWVLLSSLQSKCSTTLWLGFDVGFALVLVSLRRRAMSVNESHASGVARLRARAPEESGVALGPSVVSGTGVFAARELQKHEALGAYCGEELSGAQFNARYAHAPPMYVMGLSKDVFLDAVDPDKSNWTRYINSPHKTGKRPNVKARKSGVIVALKKIRVGDELLLSYGRSYSFA